MDFDLTAHYNAYLPAGGTAQVDVIVSVARPGGGPPRGELAEVILLDCSGSMGSPQAKMRAAQLATVAAIDALPDGTAFAVVGGTHKAEMIYPYGPELAVAAEATRAEARRAVRRTAPHGGTAIGAWLRQARELLAQRPAAIGHAILLTDGHDETETAADLQAELAAGAGRFTVDCLGIGSAEGVHDWDSAQLLGIAEALGANPVRTVEDAGTLPAAFTGVLQHALATDAGDAALRIRHPGNTRIRFVKQVHPVIADLTARGRAGAYPTGAWSPGDRKDYHVSLDVEPITPGEQRRVAWLSATSSDGPSSDAAAGAEETVTVEGTDDAPLFTAVHPTVAHYTGQQEVAAAIRRGGAALQAGDTEEALRQFGRAVVLAHAAGDTGKLALLARVVEIDDPLLPRVRLRADADPRRLPPLTAAGPQTSSWKPAGPSWPHCGQVWHKQFCGTCGASR